MTEKLMEYQNRLISETLCKMVLDGVAPDEIRKKQRFLSEQMAKLNAPSFSENLCSATVAIEDGESVSDASPKLSLQNGLDPLIEAALANIVEGLRHDWRSRMAFYWGDITRICKVAATRDSLDQRIFFLLRDGFAQFSQFLCFFEYLFLQGKYRDLSVDELVSELEKGSNRYLGEAGRAYRFNYSDGAADSGQDTGSGCDRCGDINRIHF